MSTRVVVGTILLVATAILLAYVAVNEPARMENFTAAYNARQIEAGAALFETNCIGCHGQKGQGIPGVAPTLNHKALFDGTRVKEIGFPGTPKDFVRGTIASGRPVPSAGTNYPQRMPTWSQRFGGPLRDDQIDSLVAFIMNWEANAPPDATPTPSGPVVGDDINTKLPAGNSEDGKKLTESLGCVGCHVNAAVGPAWPASADPTGKGVGTRAETRFKDSGYTGHATSAEQYLHESIVRPNDFVVPDFKPDLMPKDYGSKLTAQDLADIIAYLQTLK
ncbi:MAG: c-type cytochrome [Chloroflexi bacterium]|nr:c-type cytochrome [Chloroflexota bacterium]